MNANRIRLVFILAMIAGALYVGASVAKFGADIKAKSDARTDAVSRYLQ